MYIHDRPSWTLPDEQNVPGRRNPFPGAPYFLPCLLSETARNAKSCRRVIREPPPFTREERMQETHFVKILVSIVLFFSGSYGIYWWQFHSTEEEVFPPASPDIFHHADTLKTPDTLNITRETVK